MEEGIEFEDAEVTKTGVLLYRGTSHFRQRIVLSLLSGKPVRIEDIRLNEKTPGLKGSL
jgi:RNA 3'-terminal phosphate cyclase-like protein